MVSIYYERLTRALKGAFHQARRRTVKRPFYETPPGKTGETVSPAQYAG
jgi:hypothetical protein